MTAVARALPRSIVEGEFVLTHSDFRMIADMLHAETGITLHDGKATLLYSRLGKRLRALGMTAFGEYCALLEGRDGEDERGQMVRALTTNVTRFFREPHHFTTLREEVLPNLLRQAARGGRVRLWSSACSTGQEPYSIALTVLELQPDAAHLDIRVLATDIDTAVIEQARTGCYPHDLASSIPRDMLERWFERSAGGWRVGGELRRLVSFKPMNLVKPWPVKGPFDAIFCRNVVIYFDEPQQQAIWSRFEPLLAPGGFLFVGHSERVTGPAASRLESAGITTYRRRSA